MGPGNERMSDEVRWGVGCLVGAAAITGILILLMYVAFTFEPALWVQLVLAAGVTIGGGLLTWLVVTALGQTKNRSREPGEGVVEPFPPRPEEDPPRSDQE